MKHLRLVLFFHLIFLFVFSGFVNASSVIFSDGFEEGFSNWTGNDSQWDTTSGGNTDRYEGKSRADVRGNTEPGDDVLLKNFSTSNAGEISLGFWYKIKDSMEDEDHVYIEWSGDNSNWHVLEDFTKLAKTTEWQFVSYVLPSEAGGKENFGIRFRAKLGSGGDVFYLDGVVLSDNAGVESAPIPTPTLIPTVLSEISPSPSAIPTPIPPTPTPAPPTSLPAKATPTLIPPSPIFPSSPSPTLIPLKKSLPSPLVAPRPTVNKISDVISKPTSTENNLVSGFGLDGSVENEAGIISVSKGIAAVSTSSKNLFANSSSFFQETKFFWLMGLMVAAVVLSVSQFRKD